MEAKAILVLGCGVSGLSTGITLLRAGHPVTIWAKELPPNTTSDQAAAIWFPYLAAPREKVDPWAKHTLAFFREHLVPNPASGCSLIMVRDLYAKPIEIPWWAGAVSGYSRLAAADLPPDYLDGFEVESVVIDTSVYMDYLVAWFRRLGGEIEQKEVRDIGEAFKFSDVVVNCTGLGSRDLFGDESVYPVRGQVVKVRPNGANIALLDDEGSNGLAYVIPRTNDIVLGGTAQANDWELAPRAADREDILRKAAALDARFAQVEILSEGVGLRPARPAVRLEAERVGNATVIHNCGHGGAGFTLSWGCAEQVNKIANEI